MLKITGMYQKLSTKEVNKMSDIKSTIKIDRRVDISLPAWLEIQGVTYAVTKEVENSNAIEISQIK